MGDIGRERREVEFEPLTEDPVAEPAPEPAATPVGAPGSAAGSLAAGPSRTS